jgi:hypothetical protein
MLRAQGQVDGHRVRSDGMPALICIWHVLVVGSLSASVPRRAKSPQVSFAASNSHRALDALSRAMYHVMA